MKHSEEIGLLAAAKSRAQAAFKPIGKDQSATVQTRAGGSYAYSYAGLQDYLNAVVEPLAKEELAIFLPVRMQLEGETMCAVCTALLMHSSGQWISEEYMVPVADPTDARSGGSAATYAAKYGLKSLLGIASSEEDDDAEAARGGAHEQKKPQAGGALTCPKCGKTGTIQKNRDGSWSCWSSKGGCEAKFDFEPGPIEHAKPVQTDMMPKKTQPSAEGRSAPQAPEVTNATPPAPPAQSPSKAKPKGPSRGASKVAPSTVAAAPEAEGASSAENFPPTPSDDTPPPAADEAPTLPFSQITFQIQGKDYVTNGITAPQLLKTFDLCPKLDRLHGKDYTKGILKRMFSRDSRTELTEPQAVKFIALLEKDLEKQP